MIPLTLRCMIPLTLHCKWIQPQVYNKIQQLLSIKTMKNVLKVNKCGIICVPDTEKKNSTQNE